MASLKPTKAELKNPRGTTAEYWMRVYNWKPCTVQGRKGRVHKLRLLKLRQQITPGYEEFITHGINT